MKIDRLKQAWCLSLRGFIIQWEKQAYLNETKGGDQCGDGDNNSVTLMNLGYS